jgi:Spy/CpxP family protein refolding chaperone
MIGGQRTAAAALLISVFIAGVLGGAMGTRLLDRRGGVDWRGGRPPFEGYGRFSSPPGSMDRDFGHRPGGLVPMRISDRLARELDLTEEQHERVRTILENRHKRSEERLSEILPRLKADLDSMFLEVREVLTPEQQVAFDEILQREDGRVFGGRPGPWTEKTPGGSR